MNSLRHPATRAPSTVQLRFASGLRPAYGRTAAYRRLLSQSHALSISNASKPSIRLRLSPLRSRFLPDDVRIDFTGVAARRLHSGSRLAQDHKGTVKDSLREEPATGNPAEETSQKANADQEAASGKEKSKDEKDDKDEGEGKEEQKKEDAPPHRHMEINRHGKSSQRLCRVNSKPQRNGMSPPRL